VATTTWIDAAKILIADPAASVACPECGKGMLAVRDTVSVVDPTVMERSLVCERCGACNVIRMRAR